MKIIPAPYFFKVQGSLELKLAEIVRKSQSAEGSKIVIEYQNAPPNPPKKEERI
jgi:hypothetical protein